MFKYIIFFTIVINCNLFAQELTYPSKVIRILTSDEMAGRGYVEKGDKLAANYISSEFRTMNLQPIGDSYFQKFTLSVNTFPGVIGLQIDETELVPGKDYILSASCPSINGKFSLHWLDSTELYTETIKKQPNTIVCFDATDLNEKQTEIIIEKVQHQTEAIGVLVTKEKLNWEVSQTQKEYPIIKCNKSAITNSSSSITLNIESSLLPKYISQNVIAQIKGEIKDTFIVFSGHYDHLGKMGDKTIFPGANDNASGIAMLLSLANHYMELGKKPKYSIAFMAFGAEEAGIVGSKHYTENPLFPLENIKTLLNLDLMGFGEKGITVVNGKVYQKEFETLSKINQKKNYVKEVKARGKAMNSDHYYFSENGVPSFFIYTRGGPGAYHDIYDTAETIDLNSFNNVTQLLIDYVDSK